MNDVTPEKDEGLDDLVHTIIEFFRGTTSGEVASAFRICVGIPLLFDSVLLYAVRDRYFSDGGTLSWREVTGFPENVFSIFRWAPTSSAFLEGYLLVMVALSLTYLLGFYGQISSILLGILHVTLHHRNPYVLNGGDNLLLEFLWLGSLLPLDAHFGIRSRFLGYAPKSSFVFPQRLLQLLLCYIYLYSFGAKAQQGIWIRGEAMIDVLASNMVARFPFVLSSHLLSALAGYATLIFEALFPFFALYGKTRKAVLLVGVAFHVGIDLTLKIPLFSAMMIAGYLVFLEDAEIRSYLARFSGKSETPSASVEVESAEKLE